jgi:acetyltransferase
VFAGMQRSNLAEIAQGLGDAQRAADKPIVVCAMGSSPELVTMLADEGVIACTETVAAVDTLAALALPRGAPAQTTDTAPAREVRVPGDAQLWTLPWGEPHNEIFAAAGIASLPAFLEKDTAAAVARAARLGYPVALKLASRAHTHKSDVGGVKLGVMSSDEVRAFCEALHARLGAQVEGIVVQKMCPFAPVAEAFVGCKRDATFGDVILLGSGGIFVNEWADARILANPHDASEVERAVDALVTRPVFRALRGRPGADVAALAAQVSRIAALFRAMPAEVRVLEFNPIILGKPGEGAVVADWRADVAQRSEAA